VDISKFFMVSDETEIVRNNGWSWVHE